MPLFPSAPGVHPVPIAAHASAVVEAARDLRHGLVLDADLLKGPSQRQRTALSRLVHPSLVRQHQCVGLAARHLAKVRGAGEAGHCPRLPNDDVPPAFPRPQAEASPLVLAPHEERPLGGVLGPLAALLLARGGRPGRRLQGHRRGGVPRPTGGVPGRPAPHAAALHPRWLGRGPNPLAQPQLAQKVVSPRVQVPARLRGHQNAVVGTAAHAQDPAARQGGDLLREPGRHGALTLASLSAPHEALALGRHYSGVARSARARHRRLRPQTAPPDPPRPPQRVPASVPELPSAPAPPRV